MLCGYFPGGISAFCAGPKDRDLTMKPAEGGGVFRVQINENLGNVWW